MDIKLTDKALRYFLDTPSTPSELAHNISLCGPTFDRYSKVADDYLYEIEIITNRIDTASAQGVARDSAAILNQMGIKTRLLHDPYLEKINLYPHLPKTFHFEIADSSLVTRFTAVTLENVTIKNSPPETKTLLTLCGERPINNAVDITNELTLLYGMPSHIFDLDKLAAQKLIIRESKRGEQIVTLDNQVSKLNGGDIIIEDGAGRIVDLCGIMGGQIAEVDQHTKNILLIVPVYNPSNIRHSSLYLQKRTLAAQIYEKQPDSELCLPVLTNAIKLFVLRANARVSSSVFDSQKGDYKAKSIALDTNWVNTLIGINIPTKIIISILESLGFSTTKKDDSHLTCLVPSWRRFDINIKEDLVEEIARVYGYSKLPPTLPCINLLSEEKNPVLKTETKIKNILSSEGYNEIYNYSLVSKEQLEKSLLEPKDHLKLQNSLSQDFEYLRASLVPSILQNIKNNQGKSEEPFFLFELSNIYLATKQKLPQEISKLVMATTNNFRQTKGQLDLLFSHLNLKSYKYQVSAITPAYFITEKTATIFGENRVIGFIGSIKPAVLHKLGITSNPTIVELDTEAIAVSISKNYVYKPIPEFPGVVESMTIKSNDKIGDIIQKVKSSSKLISDLVYSDSFQNSHSFKITFSSPEKSLTQAEVNEIKKSIQNLFN